MALVEDLKRRVDRRHEERQRMKLRDEEYRDHMRAISDAEDNYKTSFWCMNCKKDFEATAKKIIGNAGAWQVAWYATKCLCGKKCIRRITDKKRDPYYRHSFLVKRSRVKEYNDMLHPHDPMFKLVYPKQWRKLEEGRLKNLG